MVCQTQGCQVPAAVKLGSVWQKARACLLDDRDQPHGDKVDAQFLVPGAQAATLLVPPHHPLDDVAPLIRRLVEIRFPRLVLPCRDHWLDPRVAIALVAGHPGGGTTGADDRAVDAPQVMLDLAPIVQFVQQRHGDADPGAVLPPAVEARVDRLPRAVALGEVAPRGPGVQNPEDAVDEGAIYIRRCWPPARES